MLRGLAVLHFISMTNSSSQHRCVFADELPDFERHDFVHNFDSESLLQRGASIDLSEPLKRTAENLSKKVEAQSQSSLFDILRNYSSKKANKQVRQLLISASQHLAKSNHQWSESERLLTAITAIEMLIAANSNHSDYKKLKNRIAALLGAGLEIEPATLHLILDGIDLSSVRHRQRYRIPHSLDQSNGFVA